MAEETKNLSISINQNSQKVYQFASDPQNLPKWAAGLSKSKIEKVGDDWIADSPMGRVKVKFCEKNQFGVLDHDVTLPDGSVTHNPMRVARNGDRSEVIFTLFRAAGVKIEEFERDAKLIQKDLETLKAIMENPTNK